MLVPFMSCEQRSRKLGTDVMAPPGAQMDTPRLPSRHGPRDDHV